jgi:protein AroM
MNTTCIGVIYIGQSPRPDCIAQLRRLLGSELDIVEAGALDAISRRDIDTFIPNGSHDTLYTRLPDGDALIISKAQVTKRIQRHIDRFAAEGIDVILMFCTGTFEGLEPRGRVVFPSAVLSN